MYNAQQKPRGTRPEMTGERNLDFSGWVKILLPDSYEGYRVSDLDWVLANVNTKKIMLVEQKNYGSKQKRWQRILFADIDKWISTGIAHDNRGWEYLGFHKVVFEKTYPENGRIWFDGRLVTKEELTNILSF